MEDDDAIMLKTKKKKLAIDPDEEAEGKPNFITTKTQEEKADRDSFEHKVNGDKPKEAKKQPEKKEDAKPKTDNRSVSPSKPKPAGDKDKQNVKRDTDQKVVVKAKPIAGSGSEKKSGETNGQVQKKAPEEKKTPSNPPPKKKKVESSEESESESEDEKPRKKQVSSSKPKPKPAAKRESSAGPETKTVVKTKDVLVYDVLKRWWYCMPDWPPAGFDYNAELAKQKLRKVDQKYWRIEPETDANGFKKVYEMPSYPGLFKNSKGEIIDMRPKDSCPSFEVFKKKSILELCELKAKALKNQIEALEKSVVVDEDLLRQLKKELIQAEKSYERAKEKK